MQKLTINNLGTVSDCIIEVKDFMVFSGQQASGKSTIAKSIYFFNNLKNVLFSMYQKQMATNSLINAGNLETDFAKEVQRVFTQIFGIGADYKGHGSVRYEYDNGNSVVIYYEPAVERTEISIEFSDAIVNRLSELEQLLDGNQQKNAEKIREFINREIFASEMDVVFIPAGRSMLTVLSSQINYLYSVMDDRIRAMIDYSTRQFIENVLLLKDCFNISYDGILEHTLDVVDYAIDEDRARKAIDMMRIILGGEYRVVNGEERLYSCEGYVKINYASSGQQEVVWILNILFYYLLGKRKTFFIIEEPESHLFPETQKAVVELVSLVKNGSNRALITTHSPYVLGSINNLLYANHISDGSNDDAINEVIPKDLWLDFESLGAYYLENGNPRNITDSEFQDINHDVIDGVSGLLNEDYEKLMDIARKE